MRFFKAPKTIFRSDDVPYLIRWNIFECAWFSIKIHKILKSDDMCLHDHPWPFLTIILKGGYVEESWNHPEKRLYGPGSILWRPITYVHRLEIYQPATTLVFTFKKTKEWGFFTPKGWVPHYDYDPLAKQCD